MCKILIVSTDLSEFNANAGNVLRSLDIRNWTFGNRLLQLPKFEITTELDVKPVSIKNLLI